MLKHGVLSVDYAEGWDKTLEHLPATVALLGLTRLTLVYVAETHHHQHAEDHLEDSDGAVESHLKEMVRQLTGTLQIEVDYELRHGFPASELVDVANRHYADVLIALNRSHSALRDVLQGNVVLNLARITTLPLLILPMDAEPVAADGKIMLAVDGSESNQKAQNCFGAFVEADRDGTVVWVENREKDGSAILEAISGRYANVSAQRLKGTPGRALVKAAEEEGVALLVIGKRGVTPLTELMLGSVAQYIIRESHRPVLLVP